MARQVQAVEVNKFNAGLITDASPLTTPDNSSLDEDNFVLNIDGSRNRRLGLDYEDNYSIISTAVPNAGSTNIAISSYRWDNAGGDPSKSIEVVQIGNELKFFELNSQTISNGYFHTETFISSSTSKFSYATVDGILVVVNGDKIIYKLEYSPPSTITRTTDRLKIRDFFGVHDVMGGVDLTSGDAIQDRTVSMSNAHAYNLRNQTFGIPRIDGNNETVMDPITIFRNKANKYPSNADNVIASLYNDAEDADDRVIDRFFAEDLWKNPLGSSRAPMGYFIIDALDRGQSRLANDVSNRSRYPELGHVITSLPLDSTPSGATVVSEFAGRVFYGGFSGEVINGDSKSPRMSSYILFSKVVSSPSDITFCYQEGDPTSKDNSEVVATDGGFIRLNGAFGIQALINLGGSLMVVASNGVWRIVGGSDIGFTATAYIVEKITDRGCTSPDSIAQIDNSFMFWSDDAIYHVTTDQFGSWVCNNISFGRIQKFYDSINIESKRRAVGAYDSYERKVRWIYNNFTTNLDEVKELVLDIQLQAYYTNTIKNYDSNSYPKVVSIYKGVPYTIDNNSTDVVVNNELVVIGNENVVLLSEERMGVSQRELGYVIVTNINPSISFTFGKYINNNFRDWQSVDGIGVDAEAYLITSYLSGTDFQRDKQVNYITVHLRRTETGYDDQMIPINPSSCLMQSRWGWSDSDNSGKWGREFQAYRYRLMHLPQDSSDSYDNGFSTIVSRNKLRGVGKVLSLRFRTEPYKDLHLYGWSMIFSVSENV
jgi:hypothetical protein